MTAPLSTSQLRSAWGPPCTFTKTTFTFWTGVTITVDHRITGALEALDAIFRKYGYRPTAPDVGAFVCRKITGGSGYSLHAYGIAVDINWQANPYTTGALVTDMPRAMVDEIVALRTNSGAPVWGWGGFYRSIKDAMHYEIVCTPAHLATGVAHQPTTTGGFGTMDDSKILDEFANVTKRTGAQLDAAIADLRDQAKKHNEAARKRDEQIIALLTKIAG